MCIQHFHVVPKINVSEIIVVGEIVIMWKQVENNIQKVMRHVYIESTGILDRV